jgi:hypothetical protein
MTTGAGPAFPAGRTLAGWSRQLAPLRPQALWVAHLTVYRVEALARTEHPATPDPLHRLVLDAVDVGPADLDRRLRLGRPAQYRLLDELERAGLVVRSAGGFVLTESGRAARRGDPYPAPSHARRVFHLVENRPTAAPHFLPLPPDLRLSTAPVPTEGFELGPLRESASRPDDWKRAWGFPADVREVLGPGEGGAVNGTPAWQRVPLVRAERLTAALVRAADAAVGPWLGFAVRPDAGFALAGSEPIFRLGDSAAEAFPELARPPDWASAWRAWCESRGVPGEARLEVEGVTLRAGVPAGAEGVRVGAEEWVLAGEGRSRAAARVELAAEG